MVGSEPLSTQSAALTHVRTCARRPLGDTRLHTLSVERLRAVDAREVRASAVVHVATQLWLLQAVTTHFTLEPDHRTGTQWGTTCLARL